MGSSRRRREQQARATAAARQGAAPKRRHEVAGLWQLRMRQLADLVWPPYTRRLTRGKALLVLVLNVAPLPGLGTVLYGKWERGLAQFLLTFVFLLGWLWAIADGARIVATAFSDAPQPPIY